MRRLLVSAVTFAVALVGCLAPRTTGEPTSGTARAGSVLSQDSRLPATTAPGSSVRRPSPRPDPPMVRPTPEAVGSATIRPHRRTVTGTASWWDSWGHGTYVAMAARLHVPNGTRVLVCDIRGRYCVAARNTTTCGCPGGRIVDLSRDIFARFADPSRGLVAVEVRW